MFARMRKICVRLGAMAVLAISIAQAQDYTPGPVPQPGVVLLRNGEIIEGRIVPLADGCQILLPDGEIRLKGVDVECVCRDLEEGYQRKRAAIQVGGAQGHLQLAQWCLRHNLPGNAAHELADAIEAEPNHPMIHIIESQLKLAMQPPAEAPPARLQPDTTSAELEHLIQGMPPGTVESFTQSIQPLLLNYCAAAACHGPHTENHFRLLRIQASQPPSRRVTQRNLQATLEWIDRSNPAGSRLLDAASHPHGRAKNAVFTDHQAAQYQRLLAWVCQVARQSPPEQLAGDAPAAVSRESRSESLRGEPAGAGKPAAGDTETRRRQPPGAAAAELRRSRLRGELADKQPGAARQKQRDGRPLPLAGQSPPGATAPDNSATVPAAYLEPSVPPQAPLGPGPQAPPGGPTDVRLIPASTPQVPQNFQIPAGAQIPPGVQMPPGVQIPPGAQVAPGFQAPGGQMPPGYPMPPAAQQMPPAGPAGPRRGAPPPQQLAPADPFDPEVFNRRYLPQPPNAQ